jgi:hypothetical protein
MPNVYIEAQKKARPCLRAFAWLLAAGAVGSICSFAAAGHWLLLGITPS